MGDFHFLRPEWLLGALAAPLVAWLLWKTLTRLDPWMRAVDWALLPSLREAAATRVSLLPFVLMAGLGSLGAFALAGPTWDATEAQVHRTMRARVVALDLSLSMNATDVAPSRLELARQKAAAIYQRTTDDQVGIVVFAGDGFFIAPLTSDPSSLIGILPAMEPRIIKAQGSRPDLGLREAGWLVRRAGAAGGEIVLITDGATGRRAIGAARALWQDGIRVSVIAVGTEAGGPVPLRGGGNLRDLQGNEVIAPVDMEILRAIADAGGGRFVEAGPGLEDVDFLLDARGQESEEGAILDTGSEIKIWLDRGPWFAAALLPLALFAFRKGWLFVFAGLLLPPAHQPVQAQGDDFGASPASTMTSAAPATEADEDLQRQDRSDWRWQAIDFYRQSRYMEAAAMFGQGQLDRDHYNRGNALAKAGFYRAALAAYTEAILRNEDNADARFNRALVERLVDEEERRQRESAENRNRATDNVDAETSGSGETQGDANSGQGANDESPDDEGQQEAARGENSNQPEGTGSSRPRPSVSAAQDSADRAQAQAQRVEASNPQGSGSDRLSGQELEQIERKLSDVVESRMGLWQRKIEQQWRNNPRRGIRRSDAW